MTNRFIVIVVIVFALLGGIFFMLNNANPKFELSVLLFANALMALLSIITYFIVKKQVSERPQAFVRGVYGATFLKLMVCMIAILTYVLMNRASIHKPSLFILFGIYTVYTGVETVLLMKMAKQTK